MANVPTGTTVVVRAEGTVLDRSTGHGECYLVELPQRDFTERRLVWFDPNEMWIPGEAPIQPPLTQPPTSAESTVTVIGFVLVERVIEAEQMVRYFMRRDEMNAEVHNDGRAVANVRYSPITHAAQRVLTQLWDQYHVQLRGEPLPLPLVPGTD